MVDSAVLSKGSSRVRQGRRGLDRKLSLEQKLKLVGSPRRESTRPNTAGGAPSESCEWGCFFCGMMVDIRGVSSQSLQHDASPLSHHASAETTKLAYYRSHARY
jgi:hypothetical protein